MGKKHHELKSCNLKDISKKVRARTHLMSDFFFHCFVFSELFSSFFLFLSFFFFFVHFFFLSFFSSIGFHPCSFCQQNSRCICPRCLCRRFSLFSFCIFFLRLETVYCLFCSGHHFSFHSIYQNVLEEKGRKVKMKFINCVIVCFGI